ncbi:hypothetical protein MEQU1_000725 [Malassezia equina]|uniref:Gamma-glutamylcyclotransferase n=1 Tax=Malassezia equina TaxID=1381935 RepID=A0AAF0EAB8_9BASI|nr:hypothetical protein MEQU1_000725 [Malassezia equina]
MVAKPERHLETIYKALPHLRELPLQAPKPPGSFDIFGYGSIIFKPPPHVISYTPGYIQGFVRRFAQHSEDHRGTPERPGRVVTLVSADHWHSLPGADDAPEGDIVWGLSYTIDPAHADEVRAYLDDREKNGYTPLWAPIHGYYGSSDEPQVLVPEALVYVGLPDNEAFVGPQPLDELAERIHTCHGPSGPNDEYLLRLAEAVRILTPESKDNHLFALEEKVLALKAQDKLRAGLRPRQYDNSPQEEIAKQAADDPIGATNKVAKMPNLGTPDYASFSKHEYGVVHPGERSSHYQVPWFDDGKFPFTQPDGSSRDSNGALKSVPTSSKGFVLKDDLDLSGDAVQPYYITEDYNADDVKRAIIVIPGMPRDSWKWTTLMQNAFRYVYTKNKYGMNKKDTIILSPLALNQDDKAAGAVTNSNWAVYKNSYWSVGGATISPKLDNPVSFFTMLDKMVDMLMDKSKFPNIDKVVIVGHSMGGQAVQRYAVARKQNSDQDDSLLWWIGNPGAWTWLNADRPTYWSNCQDQMNLWPYGLDETGRPDYNKETNSGDLVNAFRGRKVQIALGLADNGAGNTHCEAYYQGANHLDRGVHFVQSLAGMDGGLPSGFEVNYVSKVSHQDYPMFASFRSLDFIFGKEF